MSSSERPAPLPDKGVVLREHNITEEEFQRAQIGWEVLESIHAHHLRRRQDLQTTAEAISKCLQPVPCVHSLKIRVKNPHHLIAKIIRKKAENPELPITLDTYTEHITDLIGVRAIHLFKDDWLPIHEFVQAEWDLGEQPIAYVRKGDPEAVTASFAAAGCEVKEHPFGYRSIHYLLKSQLRKRHDVIELQVRTIFEEGWSEIDHQLRYPRRSEDPSLGMFLAIFNRTAGSADEMGTFAKTLSEAIAEQHTQLTEAQRNLDETLSKLNLRETERAKLQQQIEEVKKSFPTVPVSVPLGNWMAHVYSNPEANPITSSYARTLAERALGVQLDPGFLATVIPRAIAAYQFDPEFLAKSRERSGFIASGTLHDATKPEPRQEPPEHLENLRQCSNCRQPTKAQPGSACEHCGKPA